jgi:putative transposase
MKKDYIHKSHSKHLIKLHFVFAVKYRKKLLVEALNDDMLQIMFEIAEQKKFVIDTMQIGRAHV